MRIVRRTRRSFRRHRVPCAHRIVAARLIAALLPLPALLLPLPAQAAGSIRIALCSSGGARTVEIPLRESPSPREDEQPACAHLICPRERGGGDPARSEE